MNSDHVSGICGLCGKVRLCLHWEDHYFVCSWLPTGEGMLVVETPGRKCNGSPKDKHQTRFRLAMAGSKGIICYKEI